MGADNDLICFEDFYTRFNPKVSDELNAKVWHRINGMNTEEKIVEEINGLVDNWIEIHNKNEEKIVIEIEADIEKEAKEIENPEVKTEEKTDAKKEKETEVTTAAVNKEV